MTPSAPPEARTEPAADPASAPEAPLDLEDPDAPETLDKPAETPIDVPKPEPPTPADLERLGIVYVGGFWMREEALMRGQEASFTMSRSRTRTRRSPRRRLRGADYYGSRPDPYEYKRTERMRCLVRRATLAVITVSGIVLTAGELGIIPKLYEIRQMLGM